MVKNLVGGCVLAVVLAGGLKAETPTFEPTSVYKERDIRGWTILVHPKLLAEKELAADVLELLDVKLYDIQRALPDSALAKLRRIPIWVELDDPGFACACYHVSRAWLTENGYNPDKAGAVELANARTLLKWIDQQPSMILHELTHGYHDLFLGGYDTGPIKEAYLKAKESKTYESVLHWDGKPMKAYAMNNPQEYFAELTEAWFGANDFYPFVRAEVVAHDPNGAKVIKAAWKAEADE